ncbi:hypothetical protein ACJJTC_000540 [Scirpophaga incertulas]
MINTHCAVTFCKITAYNKPPHVTFHSCPTSNEMRNKWLLLLKNKCTILDWHQSKICSKHFEKKYFDSNRRLKESAVPTLFPPMPEKIVSDLQYKSKIVNWLKKKTQSDLITDVKKTLAKIKEPANLDKYFDDDFKLPSQAPKELNLWVLVKKQDFLISKLLEQQIQNRKHIELLKKRIEPSSLSKKEMEQNLETMKYIVKSLQEKQATLEEQIEILTSVESR